MADVVVAIPSFRRPMGLKRLLTALEKIETEASVCVLVADNDAERHEAIDLCGALKSDYRWPLECLLVSARGIAKVRNALVARALEDKDCRFVAMLDDDETPEPRWLAELLCVQRQTGVDALNGTVKRVFEEEPGAWARHCDGVSDVFAATGPIAMLETTANLLVRREALMMLTPPWFDPSFALGGGEDLDFFLRLKESGARFAWAKEAVVHDHVPASRANLKWALSRAYSTGNSDMRVLLKHRPAPIARAEAYARIAAALLLNPLLFVMLSASPNRRVRPLRKIYRALGKIAAIGGRYHQEYSVTHGR